METEYWKIQEPKGQDKHFEYSKHFKETDFPQQAHIWVMANETTLIDIHSHLEISHKY